VLWVRFSFSSLIKCAEDIVHTVELTITKGVIIKKQRKSKIKFRLAKRASSSFKYSQIERLVLKNWNKNKINF